MTWADSQGAADILGRLQDLQSHFGSHWQPAALLEKLASSGQRFADMRVADMRVSDVQEGRV